MLRYFIGPNKSDILDIPNVKIESFFKILEDPYGSNRMRFQYPKVFSFIYDNEKLLISKNPTNISPNCVSLFSNPGWNLPLTISFLPNNYIWENDVIIEQILPKNYGKVLINSIIKNGYKYGIVIPTFGRLEYLQQCLISLNNSDLNDVLLVIVDESLTKDVDDQKIKTKEFIENFNFKVDVIKIFKNKHGNMFDSLLIGLDLICSRCDFLMNLDSDTIHKKDWIEKTQKIYSENFNGKPLLVTGYNSSNHPFLEKADNYCIKNSVGGCHLFFSRDDYINYFRHILISNKWDTNIYILIQRLGSKVLCTLPSVIDHIGEKSSVRDEINSDKSIDF